MSKSQQFWFRSQHPPTQWNLRGGRWSSVEYNTYIDKKINIKKSKTRVCSGVCARQEQGGGEQLLQPRDTGPGPPSLPRPHLLQLPLSRLIQVPTFHTFVLIFSVVDPWHFGTDPDPLIRAFDQWSWIRLWILLFSCLTFKTPTKNYFSKFFLLINF